MCCLAIDSDGFSRYEMKLAIAMSMVEFKCTSKVI